MSDEGDRRTDDRINRADEADGAHRADGEWIPEADGVEIPPEYRQEEQVQEHRGLARRFVAGIQGSRVHQIAALVILAILLTAVFAPVIAPYGPGETYDLFKPPNSHSMADVDDDGTDERVYHLLGTDSFGHDIFSRLVFGSRLSLLVAFATVALAGVLGTSIGLIAGYYGGWIDNLLMRYVDFQWAFPEIVLALAVITFVGGLGVLNVIIAIGIAYLDDFARVMRGEVLSIREEEYVKSARAVGMSHRRIMLREIFPNGVAPLIVQATVLFPLAILWEAALSFLGLGVKPTTPTWGILIAAGRDFITAQWWISVVPGIAIMVTALAFNLLGDALRDTFDVREQGVDR